ncbi:ethanolamine ammonia-lyase subunit EutC [Acinetobacter ursingii]|uniref:ethanolamine ammonia-lyase subunit EutC n=1 Tax=Acinetobacter ursingii TaxID=108980 RepID=UPI0021CD612E|nr:ethanolamine ammonia-lyase subunit EutC [Acinetobacter ursingii]MCU4523777.1 ethanolamine ammonia-lyase subunit EutC [Acinetobacter ursingii]
MNLMKDTQYPQSLHEDVWSKLKNFTDARIALGRVGCSVPTKPLLEFQLAHAQAKDAVLQALDIELFKRKLSHLNHQLLLIQSCAVDKETYLKRPDLGRSLSENSRQELQHYQAQNPNKYDVVIVIGDGLSARAIDENAPNLIEHLIAEFKALKWSVAPLIIAQGSRVALGDEVAQILNAKMLVMLIGERPGLSSPDSLGIYYTYNAHLGCHDAMRNCISNVRPAGLPILIATQRLIALMKKSLQLDFSGVNLKDEHEMTVEHQQHETHLLF